MSMNQQAKAIETNDGLWDYVRAMRPEIEQALRRHLPLAETRGVETLFNDALRYSLFPGGKRLRPVLTLLGAEVAGGRALDVLPAAVAVEFIHSSSLVFDDLPCMDDSPKRRGQTAVHARYGEGQAILVALALMNASYGLIFDVPVSDNGLAIKAHAELVECVWWLLKAREIKDHTLQRCCAHLTIVRRDHALNRRCSPEDDTRAGNESDWRRRWRSRRLN